MILLVDQVITGGTYGSHIIGLLSPGAVEQRTLSALVQGAAEVVAPTSVQSRREPGRINDEGGTYTESKRKEMGEGWAWVAARSAGASPASLVSLFVFCGY